MKRRSQLLLSCVVLAICTVVALSVRHWRESSTEVDVPVAQLREQVAAATDPLEPVRNVPPDVAGRYILSMSTQSASKDTTSVVVLEGVARDYAASDQSMVLARNAVMAACGAYLLTPHTDPASARLKSIALEAATSDAPRMRSTFLAACESAPELLAESDFRAAVARIAQSNDTTLNISNRAAELLAQRHGQPSQNAGGT